MTVTLEVFARTRKLAHKWLYTSERTLPSVKSQENPHHSDFSLPCLRWYSAHFLGQGNAGQRRFQEWKSNAGETQKLRGPRSDGCRQDYQVTIVSERRSKRGMRRALNPSGVPFSTHVSRFQGPARPTLSRRSYTRIRQFCTFL